MYFLMLGNISLIKLWKIYSQGGGSNAAPTMQNLETFS